MHLKQAFKSSSASLVLVSISSSDRSNRSNRSKIFHCIITPVGGHMWGQDVVSKVTKDANLSRCKKDFLVNAPITA